MVFVVFLFDYSKLQCSMLFLVLLYYSELLGLWTLSFVRNPKYLEYMRFSKLDLLPTSDGGRETLCLIPKKELTSFTGPSCVMDEVHKPTGSESYTLSSEPLGIDLF